MGILDNSKIMGKKWRKRKEESPATVEQPKKEQQPIGKAGASKLVDPNLEFQLMYGLPEEGSTSKTVFSKPAIPKPIIKRLVKEELTIILVENTVAVGEEKDTVLQIVKSFAKSDLVCIINYGETVKQSEIFESSKEKASPVLYYEMTGEKACLFDALIQLEKIVNEKYLSIEETETDRLQIDKINIIGIGTCRDNGSVTSKEEALNSFYKVASKIKVTTKYFCLSEEYFKEVAEFGFHSIGFIPRTFQ